MRTQFLAAVIVTLLFALPGSAADWLRFGSSTQVVTALDARSGTMWASTSPAADVNSPMLNVSQCENFDVLFFEDTDDGGADANKIDVYSCAAAVDGSGVGPTNAGFDPTGLCWKIENVTLDGDESTDTEAIYGAAAVWIYVDVNTWVDATPLALVHCNP